MARHEFPVVADFVFLDSGKPVSEGGHVVIRYAGREIVWHVNESDAERGSILPTVSMKSDDSDLRAEAAVVQRFFSALSFGLDVSIAPVVLGFNGHATGPSDRVMFRQPGSQMFARRCHAPKELSVEPDDRLRLALALHREGRSASSPFYRFLAYWNALDVVFEGKEDRRDDYLRAGPSHAPGWFHGWRTVPLDLAEYLKTSSRHAIAHAVRPRGRPVLDPDLLDDRERLERDGLALGRLLRRAVELRWPYPVSVR